MSELATKQRELVRQFDDEASYFMDGQVKVMFAAGANGSLQNLRRVGETMRPLCVTLEPQASGRLMLGLTVSRPKNGQLVYDSTLGHWDLTVPLRRGGPLNLEKPRHRKAAVWGLQLLRGLIADAAAARSGSDPVTPLALPRVFVPFPQGQEQVDTAARRSNPELDVDYQSSPGQALVDSRIAREADLQQAISSCLALEDYRHVLGQSLPNPFRLVSNGLLFNGQYVPLSQIRAGAEPELMKRARLVLGKMAKGATDADIIAACAAPHEPMTLSLFSRHQLVSVESLSELPAPYAGCALPKMNWRQAKNRTAVVS